MSDTNMGKLQDDDWDLTDIELHSIVADWFDEGVRCVIMRNIAFCGYIGIPIDHPLANLDYDSIPLKCHGGLTFAGELRNIDGWYFYGWDYAHAGDFSDFYREVSWLSFGNEKKWTFGEVKQEIQDVLWDFRKLVRLAERLSEHRVTDLVSNNSEPNQTLPIRNNNKDKL